MELQDRLQLFVTQYTRLVVVVLVLAGVFAMLGAGYVLATPPTETVTTETNHQRIHSDLSTQGTVTGNTSLYAAGATLEDRSVYFLSATPELSLRLQTTVPDAETVTVSHHLEQEVIGHRNDEPFYRNATTLVNTTTTVSDGTASAATTLDAAALYHELQRHAAATDGVGTFEVRLTLRTTYETGAYADTLAASTELVFSRQAFYLAEPLEATQVHSTTVAETVTHPPSPLASGGLCVVGLGLIGLALVGRRLAAAADPAQLQTRLVHSRHAEWISRGEVPTNAEKQYVSIRTLADLVDVAIDTNRRVIYDPHLEAYAVIDTREIYYYSTTDDGTASWLDL